MTMEFDELGIYLFVTSSLALASAAHTLYGKVIFNATCEPSIQQEMNFNLVGT